MNRTNQVVLLVAVIVLAALNAFSLLVLIPGERSAAYACGYLVGQADLNLRRRDRDALVVPPEVCAPYAINASQYGFDPKPLPPPGREIEL